MQRNEQPRTIWVFIIIAIIFCALYCILSILIISTKKSTNFISPLLNKERARVRFLTLA